jgi:hypothetical protein
LLVAGALLQSQVLSDAAVPVFRAPFTLKIQTDHGEYQKQFEKVPYVEENEVYLFAGDAFGINLTLKGDKITQVTYQPDLSKAEVTFRFTQEKSGPKRIMMLEIKNNGKRRLFLDALMTVPEEKGTYKTSIVPIEPGLSSLEMWPHPIVQLVLGNFRFSAKAAS